MRSAASRSALPVAWLTSLATTRPLRFSMTQWPMKLRKAPTPGAFLNNRASSSLVERWVWLESNNPRKSTLARFLAVVEGVPNPLLSLGGGGPSSRPSIRFSELWDAQARSRVPSTESAQNSVEA